MLFPVKKEIQNNDDEAIRIKEEAITELGTLLAKTGQAEGKFWNDKL